MVSFEVPVRGEIFAQLICNAGKWESMGGRFGKQEKGGEDMKVTKFHTIISIMSFSALAICLAVRNP